MGQISDALKETAYKLWCSNDIKSLLKTDPKKVEAYNKEKVYWCSNCNSLHIINCESPLEKDLEGYCNKCNNASLEEGSIEDWLEIQNKKNI